MADEFQGEDKIISWFRENTYDSQGSEHIDAASEIIVEDLVEASDVIRDTAHNGGLAYSRNYSLDGPSFLDDLDLVVGPPSSQSQQQLGISQPVIPEGEVDDVWLAVNFESLMSSIQKNRKNRGQDIHSFYLSVYNQFPTAVTGAFVFYNISGLESWGPEDLINEYGEFEFADGSLAQRLDTLHIVSMENATGKAIKTSKSFDAPELVNYRSSIKKLSTGLEVRIQGDFDIDDATVDALLNSKESTRLEFKRALGDSNQDIAKEAVAMANTDGGRILYGVTNNGSPIGLNDIEKAEERVSQVLSNSVTPNIVSEISSHQIEANDVLEVKVRRMVEIPSSVNGVFYTRIGTTTSKLTGQEILNRFPQD